MEVVDGQYWSEGFSWLSLGFVSFAVLAMLVVALFLARKHASAAQRARIAMEKKVGLFVGDALVMGVVETDDKEPAIRVEIEQEGRETRQKNGYSHTWTEFDRRQTTRPFRVRIPGGTVVHVEPGKDVFLVDDLDLMKRTETSFRVMHAELTHGEEVTIEGVLERVTRASNDGEGDYRGQNQVWQLRPPNSGKMLVSTEPLPQRHELRSTFWLRAAAALAAFFLVGHGLLLVSGFWPLMANHECCDVLVESHRNWITHGRRGAVYHHTSILGSIQGRCGEADRPEPASSVEDPLSDIVATLRADSLVGTRLEEEVSGNYADGEHVPFQVQRRNSNVFRLGSGVGLTSFEWWVLVISSIALFAFGYSRFRASLPWYETKLKQSYPGRLE